MEQTKRKDRRLLVYECRGDRAPKGDPDFEGFLGVWPEAPYYYVFCERRAGLLATGWIESQPGWELRDCYELDYDQWQQVPAGDCRIGPFLVQTGTGSERNGGDADCRALKLEPGVVFGSGLHATTRGCLLTLAELYERSPFDSVVDLGTGTGILAVACALLGARRVLALDSNSLAVRVARRNVDANGLGGGVQMLIANSLDVLRKPADLLVMNIEWPSLKAVMGGEAWTRYRTVVLSGLLASLWPELEALLPRHYRVLSRLVLDDWLTLAISTSVK